MANEIHDQVGSCSNKDVHSPHLWFDPEMFPIGYRCYGVTPADVGIGTWPPKMETKDGDESND